MLTEVGIQICIYKKKKEKKKKGVQIRWKLNNAKMP